VPSSCRDKMLADGLVENLSGVSGATILGVGIIGLLRFRDDVLLAYSTLTEGRWPIYT
jgi:multisubunit Na+/H+ antiporter MnhG subunit